MYLDLNRAFFPSPKKLKKTFKFQEKYRNSNTSFGKSVKILLKTKEIRTDMANSTWLKIIQSYSLVDFRTLPVDCQNFFALTAVMLCCVL